MWCFLCRSTYALDVKACKENATMIFSAKYTLMKTYRPIISSEKTKNPSSPPSLFWNMKYISGFIVGRSTWMMGITGHYAPLGLSFWAFLSLFPSKNESLSINLCQVQFTRIFDGFFSALLHPTMTCTAQ